MHHLTTVTTFLDGLHPILFLGMAFLQRRNKYIRIDRLCVYAHDLEVGTRDREGFEEEEKKEGKGKVGEGGMEKRKVERVIRQ